MTAAGVEAWLHGLDTFAAIVIAPLLAACAWFLRRSMQRLEHIEAKIDDLAEAGIHLQEWRESHTREDDNRFSAHSAHIARVEARLDSHIQRTVPNGAA
jgi:outer membrane lipopolysaccharide assembly protein LptE/RlpB